MYKLKNFLPEALAFPILILTFLFTRLYNIMSLPIFTDEAIYTRWAQIASQDASWRFISLTDGKQPSFVWVHMVFLRLVEDPLLAGRLVSVAAGLLTVVGLYFLTKEIFEDFEKSKDAARKIGLISAFLVVLYPFSVVYDRMALYDSGVAMFFVWALYFQVLLVRKLRLDIAMILGVVLGGAVLTKSSGFLSIYMIPFLVLILFKEKNQLKERFIKFVILFGISTLIAYAMYSILRLSPYFHIIEQKNSIFVYTISEWFAFPIDIKISNFISNFNGLSNWLLIYFSLLYIALVIYSFFVNLKLIREKMILLLWFFLPFLALLVFGKTLYPRYILFMTMALIPLVALSLYQIAGRFKKKWIIIVFFVLVFTPSVISINYILNDFARAPIAKSDLDQYINDWPSGGGVKESIEFFRKEAEIGPIYIATEGTFGLLPFSYEIYLVDKKNITINGFWPINDIPPEEATEKAQQMPVYFVFYQPCPSCEFNGSAPENWPLTQVLSFKKGEGNSFLTVYRLNSQ